MNMSDPYQPLIDDATAKLRTQESAVVDTKKFINQVCQFAGRPLIYNDDELVVGASSTPSFTVTRNTFYGRALATCVREFLKSRERGPTKEATLEEIMEALRIGSYDLDAITKDKDGQKRGVAISLAKNTQAFHRLPNGDYGLMEWYPVIKARKEAKPYGNGGHKAESITPSAEQGSLLNDEDAIGELPAAQPEATSDDDIPG